ncbi:MAG: hypothetical protein QNK23_13820 [Crocinitomicaceae bacterium]|nr:hypothetical protein [Crocinitomicaceae bacterium]
MAFEGLFIRDYVGETADGKKGTSFTNSPDIVCSGPTLLPDPNVLTDQTQYDQGLPSARSQTPQQNNYIYARGLNTTATAQTATVFLYYVDTTIVLWPQNWKKDTISYNGHDTNAIQVSMPANGLAATETPFSWTPPSSGKHFCLVAWSQIGASQGDEPDLYSIGTVSNMGTFILDHPNIGWKNTIEVDAEVPSIQQVATITGPADGGVFNIGIQCEGLPPGGYIQFNVPGPDAANTINFPKTKIPTSGYAPTVQVRWPAAYESAITFTYWKEDTEPADGSNIIPIVGSMGASSDSSEARGLEQNAVNELIKRAKKEGPNNLTDVHHYGTPRELDEIAKNGMTGELRSVPIQTIFIVGSVPFNLKK